MELRQYLIDTFTFNDVANTTVLGSIEQLPDKAEAIRLFSYLINCQLRWMAGILGEDRAKQMSWWEPIYGLNDLKTTWDECLKSWIDYLRSKSEEELCNEVLFLGWTGGDFAATPKDVALQLSYHSIHHRAQIQMIVQNQGLKPRSIEYIHSHFRTL